MGRKRKTKKKRETRTRKRRKRLKKKASKLKSSPKMSLQDTTFFSTSTTTTHPKHNIQDRKTKMVFCTHNLLVTDFLLRKDSATTTLSEKSRTSLHKIIPRRSSPRPP